MKKYISIILAVIFLFLSSVYAYADFENTHSNSGNFLSDILNIAQTQVGYAADADSSKYDGFSDGTTESWAGAFISWSANEAGIPNNVIPGKSSTTGLYSFFKDDLKTLSDNSYKPSAGDIIFIMTDGSPESCGIVISSDNQYITAIAGDIDNKVQKMLYTLNGHLVFKFASPDYSYDPGYNVGTYMTTASFLNFRKEPTINSTALAQIPLGTIVTITEFNNGWGKITYNGKTGWISMEYAVEYDDTHTDTSIYGVNWKVIDVSKWQGDIDWSKVASSNIQGVIMRIGLRGSATRKILIDERFLSYYMGAKNAGLHIGCYFYTTATSAAEAAQEAQFVLNAIKQHDLEFDMPIYLDIEDAVTEKTGKSVINEITETFLEAIEAENYYAGVYCNVYWANTYFSPLLFNGRALWIAEWADKCSYNGPYGMWQYTDKGSVSGIEANSTDLNICYINYPQLIKDKGYNTGEEKPTEQLPTESTTAPSETTTQDTETTTQGIETTTQNTETTTKIDESTTQGTATTTTATEESTTESSPAEYILGDVDGNGKITAADARLALRCSASLEKLTDRALTAADADKNGKITAGDARLILRAAANIDKLQ